MNTYLLLAIISLIILGSVLGLVFGLKKKKPRQGKMEDFKDENVNKGGFKDWEAMNPETRENYDFTTKYVFEDD